MANKKVTLKIIALLVFADFLETLTQFCFKKSAIPESNFLINSFADILLFLKAVALSKFLWIGLLSVFVTFIIWSTLLSKIDLSIAVPICSFSYILIPLVSIIFLGEKISALRWVGISFILSGIIFVYLSSPKDQIMTK